MSGKTELGNEATLKDILSVDFVNPTHPEDQTYARVTFIDRTEQTFITQEGLQRVQEKIGEQQRQFLGE